MVGVLVYRYSGHLNNVATFLSVDHAPFLKDLDGSSDTWERVELNFSTCFVGVI